MSFVSILIALTLFVLLVILFGYFFVVFNSIKEIGMESDKAISNIVVLQKQRFDEVPQLLDLCKAYVTHEGRVLQEIVLLKSNFDTSYKSIEKENNTNLLNQFDNELSGKINELNSMMEDYPSLKSSEQFLHLQKRISKIEDQIADRKEFYNQSVSLYNARISSFPDLLLAKMFQLNSKEFITLD